MDRKGFLFVVTIFLILTYILISISVWVKSVETSEAAYSEFYKESTVELAIEQITPSRVDAASYIVMNRAIFNLNEHAIAHEVKEGPSDDEDANIEAALGSMLVNGTADGSYFLDGEGIAEPESSMTSWVSNLNSSLTAIGVHVESFGISGFRASQSAKDRIRYSFDMTLEISDSTGASTLSRTYDIENEVSITGLVDPALARTSKDEVGEDLGAYRQFFFNDDDYPSISSFAPKKLASVQAGQGWLYAPVVSTSEASGIPESERRLYLLSGTYAQINSLDQSVYEGFAGFIVTSAPVSSASACLGEYDESLTMNPLHYEAGSCENPGYSCSSGICTSKPFVIAPDFDIDDASSCPIFLGNATAEGRCVLMIAGALVQDVDNDHDLKGFTLDTGIFDIEAMRDYVMCGYYAPDPDAPSYVQRLMPDPYSRKDPQFGIARFVIGQYANDTYYDGKSRLDREVFLSIDGVKIRGMPGCKDPQTCADSPVTGIFTASADAIADYGLEDIACDTQAAGCDG